MSATPQSRPFEPDRYEDLAQLLDRAQGLICALDLLRVEFDLYRAGPAAEAFGGITAAASLFISEAGDLVQKLQDEALAADHPTDERNA